MRLSRRPTKTMNCMNRAQTYFAIIFTIILLISTLSFVDGGKLIEFFDSIFKR